MPNAAPEGPWFGTVFLNIDFVRHGNSFLVTGLGGG